MNTDTPSPEHPLLIGILVDVSASMVSAIQNDAGVKQNRLEAFQASLSELAQTASSSGIASRQGNLRVFAYGFGFGNIASIIFGSSPPVVDLLEGAADDSTVCITELAENWQRYQEHVESLVTKMFGSTPMLAAFKIANERFRTDIQRLRPSLNVLFVLSDGDPTDDDGDFNSILSEVRILKKQGVKIISCYVTDSDITEMRQLYAEPQDSWPSGAKLMCKAASTLPTELGFQSHLTEYNWSFPNDARLFCQVNQSELLTEFMELVISPFGRSQGGSVEHLTDEEKASIFISYCHKDAKWVERLSVHLAPLVRGGDLMLWSDQAIEPGEPWREGIQNALESASAAILIVSADFLASEFISSVELPLLLERAREEGIRIYPVVVSPCRFKESEIAVFQAPHNPTQTLEGLSQPEAEEALVTLSRAVESHIGSG